MRPTIIATFFESAPVVVATCTAGIALFLIGVWFSIEEIAAARCSEKIAILSNLCVAVPLAVFGAEHLFGVQLVVGAVPKYMPWPLFWAYFVGFALIAASLSVATKIAVHWSGLFFGIMMFLFVAMIDIPATLAHPENRFSWTLLLRETSFGGAGWILAGNAMSGWREQGKGMLITVGRIAIAIAAIFFGIEHFLHATVLPGVPLQKEMPPWIPGRALIDYVTGAILLVGGVSFLINWKTRIVSTYVGGWILLLVFVIYGTVLITALSDQSTKAQMEGINYFADTLLFAGAILALANAMSRIDRLASAPP